MLHGELHHQHLALVAERLRSWQQGIKADILASLQSFILLLVTIELAGTEDEFAKI
jgi:hypothetical protein